MPHLEPQPLTDTYTTASVLIPPASSVLDVGCNDGQFARHLTALGCPVVGVEIDKEAADEAANWCARVVVGDVETLDLNEELGGKRFDVITCLDVLEHLREPAAVLHQLAGLLRPGGRIIVSIPHVGHAAVRLQLLGGKFTYTNQGLLDRTHLRFFDRSELEAMLEDAGLRAIDRLYVRKGVTDTEIDLDLSDFEEAARAAALSGLDADIYQFVWSAAPAAPFLETLGAETLWHELELARAEVCRLKAKLAAVGQTGEPVPPGSVLVGPPMGLAGSAGSATDPLRIAEAQVADLTWQLAHTEDALAHRDLIATRARHSVEYVQQRVDELRELCGRLEAELADTAAVLCAERARLSYRVTNTVIGKMRRLPGVWRLAWWIRTRRRA